jgi:hypothetical protein
MGKVDPAADHRDVDVVLIFPAEKAIPYIATYNTGHKLHFARHFRHRAEDLMIEIMFVFAHGLTLRQM